MCVSEGISVSYYVLSEEWELFGNVCYVVKFVKNEFMLTKDLMYSSRTLIFEYSSSWKTITYLHQFPGPTQIAH